MKTVFVHSSIGRSYLLEIGPFSKVQMSLLVHLPFSLWFVLHTEFYFCYKIQNLALAFFS